MKLRTCRVGTCDRIIGWNEDRCSEHRRSRDGAAQTPTEELTLFDAPREDDFTYRLADPETSRAAAESVNHNHREAEVLNALRLLGVASSTYDIQQCLERYGIRRDRNCISRRLTSLVRAGLVSDQGKKPGPYGRDVTAYRLTVEGQRQAEQIASAA